MASYNGHESHAAWNVSLWLNNDEGLYNLMMNHIRRSRTKDKAARSLLYELKELSPRTPDGVEYSLTNVRKAMVGL